MINAYIDSPSYHFLSNEIFYCQPYHEKEIPSYGPYIKNYCLERSINLNTIDFWDKNKATPEDVYISFNHKNFIKKLYWRFKNKNYPLVNLNKFRKRILFQFEPPLVMPEVYTNIDSLIKTYDEVFFLCKPESSPRISYFNTPGGRNDVIKEYWEKSDRKFLVMISGNKKPSSLNLKRFLLLMSSRKGFQYLGYKDILGERLKVVEFFGRTNEIDLYGYGWDKNLKAYKGVVKSKIQKLSEYTFSICFENSIVSGYISEKILHCFYTGTIPIYLGASDIEKHIPKECFIDMRDFKNYEELRQFLKSLTKSEIETYKENVRKFFQSEKFIPFTKEHFAERLVNIIKT